LFITHDLAEAARVADRVAVLDARGSGIVGERRLPGRASERDDAWLFDWTQAARHKDPIFRHIHDVDERQIV
jgi:NitT/TauT family transport system ATP-binding protein